VLKITGGQVSIRITTGGASLYMGAARRFALMADSLDDPGKFEAENEFLRGERSHNLMETPFGLIPRERS
jgi:hypothetical protein